MSEKPLRIAVIDENRIRASIIEDGLREAGYGSVNIVDDVTGAMKRIVELDPDVIFIDLENPNRDELEYMLQISRTVKRPVAMFVDRSDQAATEAAIEAGVSSELPSSLDSMFTRHHRRSPGRLQRLDDTQPVVGLVVEDAVGQ